MIGFIRKKIECWSSSKSALSGDPLGAIARATGPAAHGTPMAPSASASDLMRALPTSSLANLECALSSTLGTGPRGTIAGLKEALAPALFHVGTPPSEMSEEEELDETLAGPGQVD